MDNITPIYDRILVETITETKSKGGIILVASHEESFEKGKVISVGKGRKLLMTKDLAPLLVKEGDIIIYDGAKAAEVTIDGKKLVILEEHNVMAILS